MPRRNTKRYTLSEARGLASTRQAYNEGVRQANRKYATDARRQRNATNIYLAGYNEGREEALQENVGQYPNYLDGAIQAGMVGGLATPYVNPQQLNNRVGNESTAMGMQIRPFEPYFGFDRLMNEIYRNRATQIMNRINNSSKRK